MPIEPLTHHFFVPLIGDLFRIEADGKTIELRLEEVTPLPPFRRQNAAGATTPATDIVVRTEPFSLRFKGALDYPLPQRTYRMMQGAVAVPLDIFIVPIAREHDGFVYQAVFG